MRSRILLALVLAAVATTVFLLWEPGGLAGAPVAPKQGGENHETPDDVGLQAPDSQRHAPPPVVDAPATKGVAIDVTATRDSPDLGDADAVTLRGSITVIDAMGIEHKAESGDMELSALRGNRFSRVDVSVENGLWSCQVPEDARIAISTLELGGRTAFCDLSFMNTVPVPSDRFLPLEARWPPATLLVVRAEDTALELDQIELVGELRYPDCEWRHPGRFSPEQVLVTGVSSPIELAARQSGWEQSITLFARSPGYAWGRIEVDQSRGGERILVLSPGGGLDIAFRGHEPPPGSLLSLTPEDESSPMLELPLSEEVAVRIESLPEGHYQVAVQLGRWFNNPLSLGTAVVDVVAGRLSSVAVTLGKAPALELAPLSGSLIVPEGWELDALFLSFDFQGTALGGRDGHFALYERDFVTTPEKPGRYEWTAPEVQVGLWEVSLFEPSLAVRVDVGPEGRSGVVIELPPPVRVSLRVLDRDTAELADLDHISWNPPRPKGAMGGSLTSVARNAETGTFEFLATAGEIYVQTSMGEYGVSSKRFQLTEGLNEIAMEVTRSLGVLITLKDGATTVPWGDDWNAVPKRVDGPANGWGRQRRGGAVRFTVPVSGLYRIEIPEVEGYLLVDPLEVRIEPGPHRAIEVPLVRVH